MWLLLSYTQMFVSVCRFMNQTLWMLTGAWVMFPVVKLIKITSV